MSRPEVRPNESVIVGADGETLRECDDVILLDTFRDPRSGNVAADIVREGTSGTIIIIDKDEADVECYVGPNEFCFVTAVGKQLRLLRRREEKLSHAGH